MLRPRPWSACNTSPSAYPVFLANDKGMASRGLRATDVLRAQRERAHPKSGHADGRRNTGTNARCTVQTRSPRGPR
eukprot:6623895-Prymnesium_polylepis.1